MNIKIYSELHKLHEEFDPGDFYKFIITND